MDLIYIIYIVFAITLFTVIGLGIAPHFPGRRKLMIALFMVLLGTSYYAVASLLSRPKPVDILLSWDRPDVEKAKILGVKYKEGEAIFVWLDWEGAEHPFYFRYPWSDAMAQAIQDAIAKNAENNGPGIEITKPFLDPSLDDREFPHIHPMPIPKQMDQKPDQPPTVFEYQHPGEGI